MRALPHRFSAWLVAAALGAVVGTTSPSGSAAPVDDDARAQRRRDGHAQSIQMDRDVVGGYFLDTSRLVSPPRALKLAEPRLASSLFSVSSEDYFIDHAGRRLSFTPTYEAWFGPDRRPRNYIRAGVENGIIFLLELAFYWYDPDANAIDWQFINLESKLSTSDAVRFDDNLMRTNFVYHSFAGNTHYLFTRVNGFGVAESFGVAAASSVLYELVLEWRELASINDMIVTPLGGLSVGEFFNQLGDYLNSEPAHPEVEVRQSLGLLARDAAQVTIGLPRKVHDAFDDAPKPPPLEADNLGLSSAYHHAFRLHLELATAENEKNAKQQMYGIGGSFELTAMPGFLRPGQFERWFYDGNFTASEVRYAFGGRDRDFELRFDTGVAGWYTQHIVSAPGGRRGFANALAIGSGFRYASRDSFGRTDQFGIVHVLRPQEKAWMLLGPARLRLAADLSPDFASLHSAAYEAYAAAYGKDGTRASLARHGYFHGWGISAGAAVGLEVEQASLTGRARYGHYESIDGLERNEEEITRAQHAVESVTDLGARLSLEPADSPVSGYVEAVETLRHSVIGRFHVDRADRRLSVALGLLF